MKMSKRIKYFLGHLTFSILIAIICLILVFGVWYQPPLAKAVNVTHLFLMMLCIDVIIGPLLSLLVYKEGKKSLKFDLSVILIIQLCALAVGIYSMAQGRPAWIAFHADRFELIRNNEIVVQSTDKISPEYESPSWYGVQYVAVKKPSNQNQKNDDMFIEALGGVSLAQMPARYEDIDEQKIWIQQHTIPFHKLSKYNSKEQIDRMLKQYPDAIGYLPLKASAVDMSVLVDENAKAIKVVDLRPW